MAEGAMEKTEAPTPRRLQEAKEEGNVAKSQDLTAALSLLASIVILYIFGVKLLASMKLTIAESLAHGTGGNVTRVDDIYSAVAWQGRIVLSGIMPILLCIMAIAMLSTVSQVGFNLTFKPLVPKFSRLSIGRGIQNLVDSRAGVRLVMSLLKVAVIAGLAGLIIAYDLPAIASMAYMDVIQMFGAACERVYSLALKLSALLLVLAIIDYGFQRWKRIEDLKMSKQEVKEEMRSMEGDPLVKQRRARVARQLAMQRMAQAVPKADVIVTNPTHYAIALQYDNSRMTAPKVVAKGADFMAMRIRQIAISNGIPIVERKELARAVYRNVDVGQEIPHEFYSAVAEILAYVYRLSGRRTA